MTTGLRGVMAALLTPFDQQRTLGKTSLRRLVQFNIQQSIDGLYVGGPTGEAFVQSLSERERVLEIVVEEAKGKVKLIAHIGCVDTAESRQLATSAGHYDFDAVSTITPFYYPFNFGGRCDHCRTIVDSADGLLIMVYSIPALSEVKLTLDQINTPVTLSGVGTLKQTSGDLYQMEQTHREHPDLVLYDGYDEIFASGLLAGADGGVGSTYNIMGWRYQGTVKTLRKDGIQTVQKLQTGCNRAVDSLIGTDIFRGLKTVLRYIDVVSVPLCRKPFGLADEECLPELRTLTQQLIQEHG